jgi:hypothetical protein
MNDPTTLAGRRSAAVLSGAFPSSTRKCRSRLFNCRFCRFEFAMLATPNE